MTRAVIGVLVECDPSIKAIILKIDQQERHQYIVEDLDDQTLMIKNEQQLQKLKVRLEEELANTQQMPDDSGSE